MTDTSQKVLDYLRSTGNKSFTITDLTFGSNCHLSEQMAYKVITELEECGYIQTHPEYVTNSFSLI